MSDLRVGHDSLAETASRSVATSGGNTYQTVVSGARSLSLTIGAVVPSGSSVASVTLDCHQVRYQQQASNRGLAVTVTDPHPGASDTLTVTLK